jgi:hypothetical protein
MERGERLGAGLGEGLGEGGELRVERLDVVLDSD